MHGFRDAIKYGYSNTRVKAMESKLVPKDAIERMLSVKETETIGAMMLQTNYKDYIEAFGGTKSMDKLIDFALSKSLGRETNKLIGMAPNGQKRIISAIVAIWDIDNIKFMLGALGTGKRFEDISPYLIDSRYVNAEKIKDAMSTNSVEHAIDRLIKNTPYRDVLKAALGAYRKSKDVTDADSAIDKAYYTRLDSTLKELAKINKESALLIRKRIDMKNILTMMNAKKHGLEFSAITDYLIPSGGVELSRFSRLFQGSKNIEELALKIRAFDLGRALAEYESGKSKSLLTFEVAMMNEIFRDSFKTIRHSVLSFGTLVAFIYLKEMEVFTLRVIVKGKSYALGDEEIRKMITWFK